MKKSRMIAVAMASIALTGALASCGEEEEFGGEDNVNVCVYGPPPSYYDDSSQAEQDGQELFATSSAPSQQDASQGE